MAVITFNQAWEMYRIKFVVEGKASWDNFWALRDITFKVDKGETVGIIGENGAGKSTILKLIMGMIKPDRGTLEVCGRVAGLLELGAGFQLELTGSENIYLNAGLYGLSREQTNSVYNDIVGFADIGRFIHAPVKCYSQGMLMRLAFSIAIHIHPDILVIDDTLAVGDEYFQRKCIKRVFELKEQGMTIIFVTHDTQMLSRLCQRAIFLREGRVIKDGPVSAVLPLYTQMVGSREGVGILEKDSLTIVFNNGRLFLNWKDKLITAHSGAYASFLVSEKWYSSLQAFWDVKSEGGQLCATGRFDQLAATQTWRVEFSDDYEIKWDIEMESDEPLEMREVSTNLMLSDNFDEWFTPLEEGEFAEIDVKDKHWQPLLDGNLSRRCIGVQHKGEPKAEAVNLILERGQDLSLGHAQIFNGDYLAPCRVLQHKRIAVQNYAGQQANRFLYFSGKIIVNKLSLATYIERLQDECVISSGKFKLTFNSGQGILSWDGRALTKAEHVFTVVCLGGRWYNSITAHWEVKKKNGLLVAEGSWPQAGLGQSWEIEAKGKSGFLWRVFLVAQRQITIEEQQMHFVFSPQYQYWISEYGSGQFPEEFLEIPSDVMQRCISRGAVGVKSRQDDLVDISLAFSEKLKNFAKFFNTSFYNKARLLQINKIEPEESMRLEPGRYPVFELEFSAGKGLFSLPQQCEPELAKGKLRFLFDSGRGRIYWEGVELTKKLGLYTSLRVGARWHDSASTATWSIEERAKKSLRLCGKWLYLPLVQSWRISLIQDNLIEVCVDMQVLQKIEIECAQVNLMLSERYRKWVSAQKEGVFPSFREDIDDNWDCLFSEEAKKKGIGVSSLESKKGALPAINFSPLEYVKGSSLAVVNSDIYHRGRVLQYLTEGKHVFSPGVYPYYRGNIEIT